MDDILKTIGQQIEFNQDKNIFYNDPEKFQFAGETIKAASNIHKLSPDAKQFLIDYVTDKAIEAFCNVNQYYTFDTKARDDLRKIYAELFDSFLARTDSIEAISKQDFEKLKNWLKTTNAFAEKIYKNTDITVSPVACSEYRLELQISILHIDVKNLIQPVLDVGCGKKSLFVNFLKTQNIEAYGMDRFKFTAPDLITADWLEYDFGEKKWGTIVSHLGFSNHFNHHHLREDGNFIGYARTFMNILQALKVGGCFHYAPDLPFIEKYLDSSRFAVKKFEIAGFDSKSVVIQRAS